jgi:hypothetical protein
MEIGIIGLRCPQLHDLPFLIIVSSSPVLIRLAWSEFALSRLRCPTSHRDVLNVADLTGPLNVVHAPNNKPHYFFAAPVGSGGSTHEIAPDQL